MRGEIFGRVMAPLAAVAAAIFVVGVGLSVAQAEDAKPADTKPAAATTPAVTPAKPADAKPTTPAPTTTTTPATPKTTDKKTAAAPSPCAGLDETACGASSACSWHKEGKSKKGTAIKAHCQKKPTPAKKKKADPT
jgi:hypothetical protein